MFNKTKSKKRYLLILAFTSGMTIMAVEISASRLIAPYYGTSTFIWTNIIGVIMIALAIGYYLGGKIADKLPDLKLLLEFILFACVMLLIIPFIIKPIVELINQSVILLNSASLFLFIGSLAIVVLLFLLPVLILGMVSPFIIKLLSLSDQRIGTDAGLVFSISTIGSIIGTFLPVLVFIPYFGTKKTIISFTVILMLVAIIGFLKKPFHLLILIFILPFFALNTSSIKGAAGAVYEDESAYQYFRVVDEGKYRLLMINEGMGAHTVINTTEGEALANCYYDYYNILPYLNGNEHKQDILILGLAGGAISTQLNHFYSQDYELAIDGVEIDQKIINIGKEYFNLANPSLNIINLDGRNYLDLTDKNYNSIIIDVYSNQLYIAFQLTTKEFFQSAKNHLLPNGVVAMNVNATSVNSPLLKTILNTMKLVFEHVYYIQEKDGDWNFMVLAAGNELDFSNLPNLNRYADLDQIMQKATSRNQEIQFDNNFSYLTDDLAPIEHLTDWMVLDYIFNYM